MKAQGVPVLPSEKKVLSKTDYPLWYNKREVTSWDSDKPFVQFVSNDRPKYKRHIDGYIGNVNEWSKNFTKGFYDIFGGFDKIPKVKLDSDISKSFYDSKNNLLITKQHRSSQLNIAIQDYLEKKTGIAFDEYKKLPSKKPEVPKTKDEVFIDQLRIAQKNSDKAKDFDWDVNYEQRGKQAYERRKLYESKNNQVERAIVNSNKIGIKPIISIDKQAELPVVYFETPKGQVSFHIPNYLPRGEYVSTVAELKKYLPKKIIENTKLVDDYKWSGLDNSKDIINSLTTSDFNNKIKTKSQLIDIWNKANKKT